MTKTPLKTSDPELYNILLNEVVREDTTLELIASENFVSYPVLETVSYTHLTLPTKRIV